MNEIDNIFIDNTDFYWGAFCYLLKAIYIINKLLMLHGVLHKLFTWVKLFFYYFQNPILTTPYGETGNIYYLLISSNTKMLQDSFVSVLKCDPIR